MTPCDGASTRPNGRAAAGEPLSEAPRMPLDGLKNGTDEVLGPWLPRDAAD
jgi:hypothetical protein